MTALPSGWIAVHLNDVCELLNGRAYKQDELLDEGKYRVLRVGNFFSNPNWYFSNLELEPNKYCDDGDLLYAWSASFGPKIWDGGKVIYHYHIWKTQPDERVIAKRFLYYWFEWDKENIKAEHGTGSTMIHVTKGDMENRPLCLPPPGEQRRIVAKIDGLSTKSKRARDHLNHIPRLVEKYKQAILAAAFRGELTERQSPNNRQSAMQRLQDVRSERRLAELPPRRRTALSKLPTPTSDLGHLPQSWAWVSIEELAADDDRSIQSGPFGSALLHSEFQDAGYLVIGIDNVQNGTFSLGSQNRISEAKFRSLERFRARPEDVLMTVMATVGRTCVLPEQIEAAIITKHVYRISVDKRLVLPCYLMNALRGSEVVLEQMGANIRGQTRPGLNGEIIKKIVIPLAPQDEQHEIVRRIETAFAWIDRLASQATSARKLIDHLDQAILAKAFRGELVPQDPADEPASVLLDRIRAGRSAAAPAPTRGRHPRSGAGERARASKTTES